jgi:signal transduction histidine kinase
MNPKDSKKETQIEAEGHVFHNEEDVLEKAKQLISNQDIAVGDLRVGYADLMDNYEKLLYDIKLLTRLSDKQQNKIQQQNEELRHSKHNLEDIVVARTKDLNKAYSDVLNINKELDSFVYRASHDIRGPLATFLGLCNLAKMEVSELKALEYLEMLHSTAKRMDDILNRLLAINKMKNISVKFEKLELKALIQKIVAEAQQKESFRSVKVSINNIDSLYIFSDLNIIEIMLMQMIENAVDSLFSSPQDRTQTEFIHLYLIRQEQNLCLFVKYTGIVIPPEHWEKVFEIFHRTHHRSDMTGLRLYTAKLAADKINIKIKIVESNPTQTIFELLIPLGEQLNS